MYFCYYLFQVSSYDDSTNQFFQFLIIVGNRESQQLVAMLNCKVVLSTGHDVQVSTFDHRDAFGWHDEVMLHS